MLENLREGGIFIVTANHILEMDDSAWVVFYQGAMNENTIETDRKVQEAKDEEGREDREAEIAKQAGIDALAAKQKEDDEAEEARIKKVADDKVKADAEKAELEADEEYQAFLKDNAFNEETDRAVEKDGVVRLYRLVAEFKK